MEFRLTAHVFDIDAMGNVVRYPNYGMRFTIYHIHTRACPVGADERPKPFRAGCIAVRIPTSTGSVDRVEEVRVRKSLTDGLWYIDRAADKSEILRDTTFTDARVRLNGGSMRRITDIHFRMPNPDSDTFTKPTFRAGYTTIAGVPQLVELDDERNCVWPVQEADSDRIF